MHATAPILQIQGVTKQFAAASGMVTALQDISLEIHSGEIFGIIGKSGAGKSTLVRCMNLLERPTSGSVCFNGQELTTLSAPALGRARRSMGMIFQQFNLLMQRTALANVCFPLEIAGTPRNEAKKRAAELLELVGLGEKANAYPSQLSGGQKQRVAIARALATNPKVLLCDEATSALDPGTTQSILALLRELNHRLGITIVIITHEMRVIEEICTNVAILDESRLAEVGSVEEIFAHPKSAAARRLVYPEGQQTARRLGKRCVRIVFDGGSSFEPVVANMVLECKAPVNILFADTKNIEGQAFGQMILQLPEDPATANKLVAYLTAAQITVEEVDGNV